MSTGMKKPPVAPKPRLLASQKPAPPPIAPKPELLLPSPSPSVSKRGKPALAPKPCLDKISLKAVQSSFSSSTGKSEGVPTSKNGGLSHYIIPPKSHHVGKTRGSEDTSETTEYDMRKKQGSPIKELSCNSAKDQVTLPRQDVPNHVPAHSPDTLPDAKEDTHTAVLDKDHMHTQPELHTPTEETFQNLGQLAEHSSHTQCLTTDGTHTNVSVPSPPSKPLPVPQPRRPRRNVLLRQKVVVDYPAKTETPATRDIQTELPLSEDQQSSPEVREDSLSSSSSLANTSPDSNTGSSDITDSTHNRDSICNTHNCGSVPHPETACYSEPATSEMFASTEVEQQPPAPPPRQKSLLQNGSNDYKMSSSLDHLLLTEPADSESFDEKLNKEDEEDDEDDTYGDFARCPFTRSLPKQIRLNRSPQVATVTKASSAEESSPKIAPKKPQRHSLPASALLRKQNTPPHTVVPEPPPVFGALPAPPTEKPSSWRITFSGIPLFGKQLSQSASQSQASDGKRPGSVLVKQRSRSFSSADLLRVDSGGGVQKHRSLKKLLEVRVKLFPKLLRSGTSLDGTSTDTECVTHTAANTEVTPSSEEDTLHDGEGDCGVEYKNFHLYEEIPEYMNLPWVYSNPNIDSGVYEEQEPYEMSRPHLSSDLSEEEEGLSSNEEDDNSSTSSKDEMDHTQDKEEVEKAKRNKVVHIAMEIMSSEKVFVDVLKLLHIDFRDAVAKATRASGKPVVEERVLNQILYYLPQLYELNKDLLRELEERVAHWSDHQRLADIFVQKGPYLKMYSTYIREFDRNVALLDEQCRKNPSFATVVRQFETSPRCASLALKHYLLKPVQRIPQYRLLLTDYLKNLPEDSSDYKDTQTALGVVKEVANHANDIMKQGDNFQKLMQVQCSLNGHHEIVQPGRVFLKEGTLMKLSRKVMQPRMFFLFNDILLYTTPVQSGQYKVNSMLSLAGMKVSKPSQEAYQNELNIESVERSFILSASSATERDEWLEAITTAIDDYTKKKISFISSRSQESEEVPADDSPLGSKAPIWIPDLRTTMCMICTCEFTLTWRRHHCRACGKVVCQACSSNKYYLEYLKNQLARVCDQCYVKLQQKDKGEQSEVAVSPSGRSSAFSFSRKQKKIPSALKEVSANTENSSMSGYLQRSKAYKKPWKRLWFVIKNKVLYTYAASEDVAALESQPLLGFFLREEKSGPAEKLQFKLYHKNILYYIFRADDIPTAQRWIEAFQEAMIL
ncbi:FYVE, RhoGEF and PH domain-containing protein 6 isoform X1 [Tachysurus fulvidraco]|uniref:FYVE, RhoGEF and PH domain-containing protein 6 isoform X1 n=2 Tax=Tachysurus fulvidraco TaxID=1234273 RepID=UPI000F4FBA0B|nr:FYVE, RhoGEF and PH domain-containing protein 6 isoform X1 [Tachysurus fulvidraco]